MNWLLILQIAAGSIFLCFILCLMFPGIANTIIELIGEILENIIDND